MARDAIAFLAAMEFGQADVLGFSIGSFVAQDIALIRPGVLRRLIPASSAPQGAAGMHGWVADVIDAVGVPEVDPERVLDVFNTRSPSSRHAGEQARWRAGISADVRQDAGPGPADNLDHPAGPVRRGLRWGSPIMPSCSGRPPSASRCSWPTATATR
jgi:pimeloyl-ACP methyl ester carboxylesterase